MNDQEIGRLIKKLRMEKKLSQHELASKINCSQAYISNIEKGITSIPLILLSKISLYLDVDLNELLLNQSQSPDQTNFIEQFKSELKQYLHNYRIDDINRLLIREQNNEFIHAKPLQKIILREKGRVSFYIEKNQEKAFQFFQDSLAIPETSKEDILQNAETFNAIGNCYYELSQYNEAIKNYQIALNLSKRFKYSENSYYQLRFLLNYSKACRKLGNLQTALDFNNKAFQLARKGTDMYLLNSLYYQQALLLNQMKNILGCREALNKAMFFSKEMNLTESFPYEESLALVLELNEAGIWEHNNIWLTEYSIEETFYLYTKLLPKSSTDVQTTNLLFK